MTGSNSFWFANPGQNFYNGVATQSLRFNDDDDAYLSRTPAGASNRKTWTYSTWFKIANTSASQTLFSGGSSNTGRVALYMSSGQFITDLGGTGAYDQSTALFRDPSAWYHLVWAFDTTQGTGANRSRIYINGTEITLTKTRTWAQDTDYQVNNNTLHVIGGFANAPVAFSSDAYHAETNFVDGSQLTPSSFGETKNGVWIPIEYEGSYGTNGFRLQFASTTHDAPASEGSADTDNIGADSSGENNHWTASDSIDTEDCNMPDCPENNFSTLTPLFKEYATSSLLSEGNLKYTMGTAGVTTSAYGSMAVNQNQGGKWYAECRIDDYDTGSMWVGVFRNLGLASKGNLAAGVRFSGYAYKTDGNKTSTENNGSSYGNSYGTNNVIGIALDLDNDAIYFYKDGTIQNSGTAAFTSITTNSGVYNSSTVGDGNYIFGVDGDGGNVATFNFGQDSTFNGQETAGGNTDANGLGDFHTAVPSGYLAVCSANLPEPTIGPNSATQADDYFNTVLYTGNGSGQSITGVGFQPDWVWAKERSSGSSHQWYDSSRGVTNRLESDNTGDEDVIDGVTSFDTDGFTIGTHSAINDNGVTNVAWNWKANGGTTTTNDASATSIGSQDSVYQSNTTAGFSIVTYTGTGANDTFAHGVQVNGVATAPRMIIMKRRDSAQNWVVYHAEVGNTRQTFLNLTNAQTSENSVYFNNTSPTSTVFSLGSDDYANADGGTYVAYCFADVEGYSKFGSYIANGSNDGPFIFTGFEISFLMIKRSSATGVYSSWAMYDNKRKTINSDVGTDSNPLFANKSPQEGIRGNGSLSISGTRTAIDFLSNGFKLRDIANEIGVSNNTYIYMAFAKNPFKYSTAQR